MLEKVSESTWALDRESERESEREGENKRQRESVSEREVGGGGEKLTFFRFYGFAGFRSRNVATNF